jgi:hypothetical protein
MPLPQELNLLAFNFFLLYFKIFKYIKQLPKMNQIVMTIAGSSLELFLFIGMVRAEYTTPQT